MHPLRLSHYTIVSSIGAGLDATLASLREGRSGLRPCAFETVDLPTYVGEVPALDDVRLPAALAGFDCRNNRLAEMALGQDGFEDAVAAAVARYGARRIGLFVGTSTSGILQAELAYRERDRRRVRCLPGSIMPRRRTPARSPPICAGGWGLRDRRSSYPAPALRRPKHSATPRA